MIRNWHKKTSMNILLFRIQKNSVHKKKELVPLLVAVCDNNELEGSPLPHTSRPLKKFSYANLHRKPNTHTPFLTEKMHIKRIVFILRPAVDLPRISAGNNINTDRPPHPKQGISRPMI